MTSLKQNLDKWKLAFTNKFLPSKKIQKEIQYKSTPEKYKLFNAETEMEKTSAMKSSLLECLLFYVYLMCSLSSFLFYLRKAILLISVKWLHMDAHNRCINTC